MLSSAEHVNEDAGPRCQSRSPMCLRNRAKEKLAAAKSSPHDGAARRRHRDRAHRRDCGLRLPVCGSGAFEFFTGDHKPDLHGGARGRYHATGARFRVVAEVSAGRSITARSASSRRMSNLPKRRGDYVSAAKYPPLGERSTAGPLPHLHYRAFAAAEAYAALECRHDGDRAIRERRSDWRRPTRSPPSKASTWC